ncbi:MAG TPA: peptidoglycan-binding protein [Devosiaceae bacterium]|jgi:localization factor PodJL
MARAFQISDLPDNGKHQQPGEWQVLRNELATLLDQVETQYSRMGASQPGMEALARRVEDLRQQMGTPAGGTRHREALRSVKKAVDRFTDRDEVEMPMEAAQSNRSNPRDVLESAIQEIRARHRPGEMIQQSAAPQAPFNELARSVSSMTSRLERIETDIKAQRDNSGDVREIAEQMSQLTHVVELLAGAVGETGQVKRLEAQIAELATSLQAPKPDIDAMTQRLGDLAQTVDRLADIQIQHIGRETKEGPTRTAALQDGMLAIEQSVRNVYDRIDAIERNLSTPSTDLERLTDTLAAFTETLRDKDSEPQQLLPLMEALAERMRGFDDRDGPIGGLKADIGALHQTVSATVEPRFAAIEDQITALSDRIGTGGGAELGISQIEGQIRQLVARMDQTGEQLASLAKMQARQEERPLGLSAQIDELASLVARKTSDAVAKAQPEMPVATRTQELSANDFDEIEKRMSKLFSAAQRSLGTDDIADMQSGIRHVDERLERLEAAIGRINSAPKPAAPAMEARAPMSETAAPVMTATPRPAVRIPGPPAGRSDDMPHNPSEDRPLTDAGFADLAPVRAALEEAAREPRPLTPASKAASAEIISKLAGTKEPEAAAPVIDPASIARPPRPVSAFDTGRKDEFTPPDIAPIVEDRLEAPQASQSSRNTFIEAARRAAQRQTQAKPEPTANSLIGRAISRFQNTEAQASTEMPVAKPVKAETSAAPEAKKAKVKKAARVSLEPEIPETFEAAPETDDVPELNKSFISRYRRPILIGCAVVAVSLLTLNLVMQRLHANSPAPKPAQQTTDTTVTTPPPPASPAATPPASEPAAQSPSTDDSASVDAAPTPPTATVTPDHAALVLPDNPEIIPSAATPAIDTTTVGAIDPSPAMNFTSPTELPAMPSELRTAAVNSGDLIPQPIDSPVKVELPPEALGPLQLRQAAANGDARAQFEVAAIYTEGRAVPQDLKAAAVWYERAAAQGFVPAEYRLGSLYEAGKGLDKDLEQARLWYQRAAEAGNRMSMHNLAALYAGGVMGKQDFASAAEWFEQAAMRGLTDSQFNLGMLYARGLGVSQNLETSYKWFSLAAKSGDPDSAKQRDDVAKSLDAATVTKLTADVDNWKPTAIDLPANFAPIGTWSPTFDAGQTITDKKVVSKVQAVLAKLGYDVGTPDGLAGAKTATAIKSFEQSTGMNQTGAINPRLLAVLGSQPV